MQLTPFSDFLVESLAILVIAPGMAVLLAWGLGAKDENLPTIGLLTLGLVAIVVIVTFLRRLAAHAPQPTAEYLQYQAEIAKLPPQPEPDPKPIWRDVSPNQIRRVHMDVTAPCAMFMPDLPDTETLHRYLYDFLRDGETVGHSRRVWIGKRCDTAGRAMSDSVWRDLTGSLQLDGFAGLKPGNRFVLLYTPEFILRRYGVKTLLTGEYARYPGERLIAGVKRKTG